MYDDVLSYPGHSESVETAYGSDFRRLTFFKETARSPEQLCVTTGNLYHSLCQ